MEIGIPVQCYTECNISPRWGYRVNGQGEWGILVETGRTGISGQGQACRVPKWIKGAKVRTRNRNVIETKQGPWKQDWDKGKVKSEF